MMIPFFILVFLASVRGDVLGEDLWQNFIIGPQSLNVYPVSVVSSGGSVINPTGLLPDGTGDTVLKRAEGETAPYVILDFGLNVVGFLNITFNGASDNTPGIRLAFSETMQYLSDVSDYSRSNMANPITPGSDQIAVRPQPYTWTATWGCQNGTQVCCDGLHGFRYMKIYLDALEADAPITSSYGTVNISSVVLAYSGFLATNDTYQGWFVSSDDDLNRYWYAGVYTNDLTTDIFRATDIDPRDAYTSELDGRLVLFDGAKRDRDPYVGDVAVSGITSYLSHLNATAVASSNVLADLADHQRADGCIPPASVLNYGLILFDYALWWIVATRNHMLYTGDLSLGQTYFPNIIRVLDEYYPAHTNNETHLLNKPDGEGDYAFVGRSGEVSYYNALYVLALKAAAEITSYLGDSTVDSYATAWLERADVVSLAFNEYFWDESVGAYRSGKTSASTAHPQDGNALAILAGIANSTQANSALLYLDDKTARPYGNAFLDDDSLLGGGSQRVYAFMSSFDISARFESYLDDSAFDQIKRLFGWMYTHDPELTYWEGVGPDGSMYQGGFTSSAHGWSTGVVGVLTNYALGMKPLSPGGLMWGFDPHPGNLTWASGSVPALGFNLVGGWQDINGTFVMEISVPPQVSVKAAVPVWREDYKVTHNGKLMWSRGVSHGANKNDHDRVVLPIIGEGYHIIIASPAED